MTYSHLHKRATVLCRYIHTHRETHRHQLKTSSNKCIQCEDSRHRDTLIYALTTPRPKTYAWVPRQGHTDTGMASQAPRPQETHPRHSHQLSHPRCACHSNRRSKAHSTFSPAYPGCGGDFPTGPQLAMGTPPHGPHLALQVGSLEPARVVRVDDLHDMGAAKALLLHFLCCPDVGKLDEGALLEGRGQGEGNSGS